MTALHETTPQASALPSLSLRRLRDMVVAGDPGCLCDPELFTGPTGIEPEDEPADDRAARIAVAREVCAACPVRLACTAYALRTRPAAGVWAGFTPDEITALVAAANRPARPRWNTVLRPARAGCRGGVMELFVILTIQKAVSHGARAATLKWTLTPGPAVDRAGLLDYVLERLVPADFRSGVVLFYSAEPLSFAPAPRAAASVPGGV